MVPHSSTLAWKIPWMEEPGRLRSMRSLRVGHDWATSLSLFTFMHLRRKWQPTPVFLPGESQGRGSLVGWRLWGHTESSRLKWLSSSSRQMVGLTLMRPMVLSPLYSYPPVNPTFLSKKKKKIGHRNLFPFSYDSHLATSILFFFSFLF